MTRPRILGMIPGFKPPEGVVEVPKGFTHLPTQAELAGSVRSWLARYKRMDPYLMTLRQDVADEEQADAVRNYNRSWEGNA
ncbi:hypothetical protein D3C81_375900 [compost metagenome]